MGPTGEVIQQTTGLQTGQKPGRGGIAAALLPLSRRLRWRD